MITMAGLQIQNQKMLITCQPLDCKPASATFSFGASGKQVLLQYNWDTNR